MSYPPSYPGGGGAPSYPGSGAPSYPGSGPSYPGGPSGCVPPPTQTIGFVNFTAY